jgi:hypothetical protein
MTRAMASAKTIARNHSLGAPIGGGAQKDARPNIPQTAIRRDWRAASSRASGPMPSIARKCAPAPIAYRLGQAATPHHALEQRP